MLILWQFILVVFFPIETFKKATSRTILIDSLFLHGILATPSQAVPGGWYIGAQMMLYFLFPYILEPILKCYRRWRNLWLPIIYSFLLLVSAVTTLIFNLYSNGILKIYINQTYTSFLCQLAPYITGIILAYQYEKKEIPTFNIYTKILFICALGIALISYYVVEINIRITVYIWSFFFYLLLISVISIWDKIKENNINNFFINWGKRSYSIYLIHFLFSAYMIPHMIFIVGKFLKIENVTVIYTIVLILYVITIHYSSIIFDKLLVWLTNSPIHIKQILAGSRS